MLTGWINKTSVSYIAFFFQISRRKQNQGNPWKSLREYAKTWSNVRNNWIISIIHLVDAFLLLTFVLNLLITLLVIFHLKSRSLFSFSLLQNNNLTRIPDQAFKKQEALEVMYVRKWLPLAVVTIRCTFCTVTWEHHRFRVILF